MPVWNLLAVPLQDLTLAVVKVFVPAIGPATFSGPLITFPGGIQFEVTIWCSGLGFLVQGIAVATLMGELEDAPAARRLRLIGSMIVIALVSNWFRVLALIQIGYSSGMRHVLVTRHHLIFGYAVFVVVLMAFVWVATRSYQPQSHPVSSVVPDVPNTGRTMYFAALAALVVAPLSSGLWTNIH
jgi:exosortase